MSIITRWLDRWRINRRMRALRRGPGAVGKFG